MKAKSIIKWVTIASVILGFGATAVAGKGQGNQSSHDTSAASLKRHFSIERKVIRVSEKSAPKSPHQQVIYRPPPLGAPSSGNRVGGATRAPSSDLPTIFGLVPDSHMGMTVREQPTFAWYISDLTTLPLYFTLIDAEGVAPIIEESLSLPTQPGIQLTELGAFGKKLEKGKVYQWTVSLMVDENRRSKDIVGGGLIQLAEQAPAMQSALLASDEPTAVSRVFAESGLWYDALGTISQSIRDNPSNSALRNLRADLLEQVDLGFVAEGDRQTGL